MKIIEKLNNLKIDLKSNVEEQLTNKGFVICRLDRDTDIEICRFDGFGKSFIKSSNCSPDAFMQMALQLTYYK